ncbi:MAG TPA: hypothetical protein VM327_06030 [Candidatus Thermoplasmatota archaeon]|nr:hypothetical protein [Candidatus Thermoplasmatota archaeon]
MRITVVLLMGVALLAGCLDDAAAPDEVADPGCPAGPFDQEGLRIVPTSVDPIVDDKDRATEFETTNIRTCSLPAIGWSALDPDGTPHKYLGELDMRGDLGLGAVAVVGSGEAGRVYLVDITERMDPVVLSFIDLPGAHVTDVKISDDGKVLYVASQALPTLELATGTAPEVAASSGFTAYGLADPTAPAYLGTVPDEGIGCHMLDPVQVSPTQDAVMCVSSNLKSYLVQRDGPRLVTFGFVEYLPSVDGVPTPSAVPAAGDPTCSLPAPLPAPGVCALSSGPHDMTAFHEAGAFGDGASYLVVSHWDEGVKVLDITEAPVITEVGSWDGEGAEHYDGNVHTAMLFDAGGKRYIVASPEYTSAGTVPGLWVLDATDLSDLKLIAEWYHPGLHDSQGLYLTTHQWQVAPTGSDVVPEDVRIYLTMNHGGMWVLDFGAILRGDDQGAILGFNLARTPIPEDHVANAILSTWDVNVVDGYIYGTDRATGLWVFHYSGDEYDDPALTGFA